MDEKIVNISMELISTAGNAKGTALNAINIAQKGDLEGALTELKLAKQELTKVHKIHGDLIMREAGGESFQMSLLFVHAQDHLTSAIVILDLAEHMINLYTK